LAWAGEIVCGIGLGRIVRLAFRIGNNDTDLCPQQDDEILANWEGRASGALAATGERILKRDVCDSVGKRRSLGPRVVQG